MEGVPTCDWRRRCCGGGVCGQLESAVEESLLVALEAREACRKLQWTLRNASGSHKVAWRLWWRAVCSEFRGQVWLFLR